jgi:hypothetical protein
LTTVRKSSLTGSAARANKHIFSSRTDLFIQIISL